MALVKKRKSDMNVVNALIPSKAFTSFTTIKFKGSTNRNDLNCLGCFSKMHYVGIINLSEINV